MNNAYKILDVRIDNLSKKEILKKLEDFLANKKFNQIVTVNPEFVLEAQNNLCFKNILNASALNVADGFGIDLAFWRYGKRLRCRIAGVDLMEEIFKTANRKKLKLFLAVRKGGLSNFQEIKNAISKKYPEIEISGADLNKNTNYCSLISDQNILLCNFGAPAQEIFLDSQKSAIISLAMGVGGSFDFLTGKVKRAPRILRQIGLEWFWRMFQPQSWRFKKQRLKRIWKAVIVFPIKIIF